MEFHDCNAGALPQSLAVEDDANDLSVVGNTHIHEKPHTSFKAHILTTITQIGTAEDGISDKDLNVYNLYLLFCTLYHRYFCIFVRSQDTQQTLLNLPTIIHH